MSKNKIYQRSKIKTFVKVINKNHIFPTRYVLDLEKKHKENIDKKIEEVLKKRPETNIENPEKSNHLNAIPLIDNIFMDRFFSGKNKWFFTRLKF